MSDTTFTLYIQQKLIGLPEKKRDAYERAKREYEEIKNRCR